ncbi:urease accessory protein UreD [Enterococcus sp. AZ072]|uniref:urease accessory protein UreD n=1 Tax=unclassified Enterococcus TaxID=2608891 RepID=UPI003D27E975
MKTMTGTLELAVKQRDNRTVPGHIFYQGALKVMRPQYLDDSGQVTYFVLNPGGGYLDGDRYSLTIDVGPEASLYLTTQSATKVYQTPKDHVYQLNQIAVKAKGELINLPDPIIPYEKSIYQQEQLVYLANDARYFASEIVTPGWDSAERGFTYRKVNLLTKIYLDNHLAVMDRVLLQPDCQNLAGAGMLEGLKKIASLLVVHPEIDQEYITQLHQELTIVYPALHFGLSLFPINGYSLRVLGNDTQEMESVIQACYQHYNQTFCKKKLPQTRKY